MLITFKEFTKGVSNGFYQIKNFLKYIGSGISRIWPIVKKLLDPVDDIMAAIRAVADASKLITTLIGVCGGFLHGVEFFSTLKKLIKQISEKTFHYIKTTFASINLVLSGAGLGLGITLLIGTYTALPILPIVMIAAPYLLPGLMLVILANKFIKNKLLLRDKEIEMENKFINDNNELSIENDYLKNNRPAENASLEEKAKYNSRLEVFKTKINTFMKEERDTNFELHKRQTKLMFNKLEIFASAVVFAGIVSGFAPIVFFGVALGLAVKIVEFANEKTNHGLSRWIAKRWTGKEVKLPDETAHDNEPPKMILTLAPSPVVNLPDQSEKISENLNLVSNRSDMPEQSKLPITTPPTSTPILNTILEKKSPSKLIAFPTPPSQTDDSDKNGNPPSPTPLRRYSMLNDPKLNFNDPKLNFEDMFDYRHPETTIPKKPDANPGTAIHLPVTIHMNKSKAIAVPTKRNS
jgi:hypothetical protein